MQEISREKKDMNNKRAFSCGPIILLMGKLFEETSEFYIKERTK